MNKIFQKGRKKYGDRALSTSIVKLIEDECGENLRAIGFPSILEDKEIKKYALEVKLNYE